MPDKPRKVGHKIHGSMSGGKIVDATHQGDYRLHGRRRIPAPTPSWSLVLKGFDSGVNSRPMYLYSNHCSLILGITNLYYKVHRGVLRLVREPGATVTQTAV